eukprot:CAMPEP_0205800790 /NCGR_PEP_ID=MMETSP0205-20121125/2565_1 /ASSEMBLY_ACC=CAM_ASM_000278 /TAXON_ID=36767 /ORGANISM="Euplotes focardii, Strain TN1" /LENGTH=103 /DNA_ID=CAMNT_0053064463 /DNA_START=42 /DNA_END=350 /DNA_ORIENTATION=-
MIEKKEEGSDEDSENKSERGEGEEAEPKKETKMVEAPLEDKVQLINPRGTDYNIMVLHQAGARLFRKEICQSLKRLMPVFEDIDVDEVSQASETLAKTLENKW